VTPPICPDCGDICTIDPDAYRDDYSIRYVCTNDHCPPPATNKDQPA
jgi:hypothetical protein